MAFKGKLDIDQDRCKGCSLCVSVCPVKILEIDTETVNKKGYNPIKCIDMDKCIGCTSCGLICPDLVFEIERSEVK